MKSFRLAFRYLPGVVPGRPTAGPGRRWLRSLAGACLAAVLAGWPTMLAAGGAARPPTDGPGVVLTAAQGPQARVLNPGPPTGLTATAGNGQVTLSWKAPAADGGAAITSYNVYRGTSSHGESASPVNTSLISGTSYTLTGLANGTAYYFTVAAVNSAKRQGKVSGEASATPVSATASASASTSAPATAEAALAGGAPVRGAGRT